MKLEDVKGALAKTAMTLDTQRELNATDNLVDCISTTTPAHTRM
jgi:hypothetical protein